jgi:hypothetical protein
MSLDLGDLNGNGNEMAAAKKSLNGPVVVVARPTGYVPPKKDAKPAVKPRNFAIPSYVNMYPVTGPVEVLVKGAVVAVLTAPKKDFPEGKVNYVRITGVDVPRLAADGVTMVTNAFKVDLDEDEVDAFEDVYGVPLPVPGHAVLVEVDEVDEDEVDA